MRTMEDVMKSFKEIWAGWNRKFDAASVAGAYAEAGEFETARILYQKVEQGLEERPAERPRTSPRPRPRAYRS